MAMRFRPARTVRRSPSPPADGGYEAVAALVALTYELLDAHADTAQLAADDATGSEWRKHLAYLRDLQRVGRESLARVEIAPP
jgi:hypothetical protein